MDALKPHHFAERGELYLCLARAFLTPSRTDAFAGLRDALAGDLAELDGSLTYGFADELATYRQAIRAIPDHAALLQLYSSLFLTPPRSIHINTGSYLDGAVNGGSVAAMEACYRRCGVERGADFHDLSDHVSVQLEFVALLYFRSAEAAEAGHPLPEVRPEHFLHGFVLHWLPPFIRDLEEDAREGRGGGANPYLALTRILAAAVARDAFPEEISARERRAHEAITKARHDRAERGVTAEDMEIIARKLREKGLSTEHLAIPPELRDEARGYTRKQPPRSRRGARYG